LNLFVGQDNLRAVVEQLREGTYMDTGIVSKYGIIPQTALFPLWSHKGLEANLASDPERHLLAAVTINIFLNARQLPVDEFYGQRFDYDPGFGEENPDLDKKYSPIKGATVDETNDAMTMPNVVRMAEVSPTVLFEFSRFDLGVDEIIKSFYYGFLSELEQLLEPPQQPAAAGQQPRGGDSEPIRFEDQGENPVRKSDTGVPYDTLDGHPRYRAMLDEARKSLTDLVESEIAGGYIASGVTKEQELRVRNKVKAMAWLNLIQYYRKEFAGLGLVMKNDTTLGLNYARYPEKHKAYQDFYEAEKAGLSIYDR
jgi:hypothetical protein